MTAKELHSPVGSWSDHVRPVPLEVTEENLRYWMRLVLECSDEQADELGFDEFADVWMAVVETEGGEDVVRPRKAFVMRQPGALEPTPGQMTAAHVRTVFRIWIIVFGLVGAQMAWVLRPFIGSPHLQFAWFRPRESNFFEGVMNALRHLMGW